MAEPLARIQEALSEVTWGGRESSAPVPFVVVAFIARLSPATRPLSSTIAFLFDKKFSTKPTKACFRLKQGVNELHNR